MRSKVRIVECASNYCTRKFETRSRHSVQYCAVCKVKRYRQIHQRYLRKLKEYQEQDQDQDQIQPDAAEAYFLRKLDTAEYSIQNDAGPEEEAFRPGSRLTRDEVFNLLKFGSIAENSILIHNPTGRLHCIKRNRAGRLVLDPPHTTTNGR